LRRRSGQQLDHFLERHHVDRVVIGRASEFALLWRGRIAQRHAQAAADAEVGANGTDHPAVDVGFLDDAAGNRAGRLANRARKRTETAIGVDDRDRLRGLLARPAHHLGPHGAEL